MVNITATQKWLLAGIALLAMLSLLRLQHDPAGGEIPETAVVQTPAGSTAVPSQQTSQPASSPPDRPARRLSGQVFATDPVNQMLADLRAQLPPASTVQASAIGEQVSADFDEFLLSLAGDEQRQARLRDALEQAVFDVAVVGAALQAGVVDAAQLDNIANPNHVLDRVADMLESEELTRLETYMEAGERKRFMASVDPQVQISAPELNSASRELLLDTLFAERYASMNPYGIGAHSALGSNLEQQLEAITTTRESLRMSLPPDQFEIANGFLQEQATAISTVRNVFSGFR